MRTMSARSLKGRWKPYHYAMVKDYNPPTQFLVESFSGESPYLVDISNYNGNGQCDCTHFKTRLEPRLSRGEGPSPELQCKHIDLVLAAIAKREGLTDAN